MRVLVVVDGFPINPMTYEAIQRRVAHPQADGRPGEPGHVINQEERDMVESVTERTKLTFAGLLEGHERGSLWRAALKDWMLVERKLQIDLAERLMAPSKRAWRHVLLAFGPEAEPPDE